MMYKENKRRRRDKPHTTLDNVNDDNETREVSQKRHITCRRLAIS